MKILNWVTSTVIFCKEVMNLWTTKSNSWNRWSPNTKNYKFSCILHNLRFPKWKSKWTISEAIILILVTSLVMLYNSLMILCRKRKKNKNHDFINHQLSHFINCQNISLIWVRLEAEIYYWWTQIFIDHSSKSPTAPTIPIYHLSTPTHWLKLTKLRNICRKVWLTWGSMPPV